MAGRKCWINGVMVNRTEYGEYLFVFSPNTGKYGPEKTPHLDTFHAVTNFLFLSKANLLSSVIYEIEIISRFMNKK